MRTAKCIACGAEVIRASAPHGEVVLDLRRRVIGGRWSLDLVSPGGPLAVPGGPYAEHRCEPPSEPEKKPKERRTKRKR